MGGWLDEFRFGGLRQPGSQLGTVPRVANPRRAGLSRFERMATLGGSLPLRACDCMKLDLNLGQCQGLQTLDEREVAVARGP